MPITAASLFLSAILTMGSMALSKALQKKGRGNRPSYTWEGATTQRDDIPYPLVFGRMKVNGNVITQYRESTFTSLEEIHLWLKISWGLLIPPSPQGAEWNLDHAVKSCSHSLYCRIGIGEGPIAGFVAGKGIIDGKYLSDLPDVSTSEKLGTDSQTATDMGNRIEYPQDIPVTTTIPVTVTMPDKDYYRCGIVLGFESGFVQFGSDGDKIATRMGVKIEIREVGGAWTTLFDYYLFGKTTNPIYYLFTNDGTYSNGTPFVVTSGTQHEWRVTCTYKVNSSSYVGDLKVTSVQAIYDDGYTFPGLAYREVRALASESLSGSLEYEDVVDGLICESIDGTVLEWTDNPARIAKFVACHPVIKGTGESGDPYVTDYYRGHQPSKIHETEFEALESWCDELVSDGESGTEARFTFNGIFNSQEERFDQLQKIGSMCRGNFWFDGQKIRCWIDKPTIASHVICMGNISFETYQEASTDIARRPKFIESTILDEATDFSEQPVRVVNTGSTSKYTMNLDGFGCTRVSQFTRLCKFMFDKADNNDLVYEWEMDTAGLDLEPGHVAYIQHDSNGRGHGGRILAAGSDWVQIDKQPVVSEDSGVTYKLVVQTIDATGKHVNEYNVTSVTADYKVYVDIPLTYVPVVGDVYIFAQTEKLDKVRITTVEIRNNASVRVIAEQYKTEYYQRDSGEPEFDTLVYRSAIRSGKRTLRPVTRQDLLYGLPEERIFDGDSLDSVKSGLIEFQGDSVDTVTWLCGTQDSGAIGEDLYGWVRYKGVTYFIVSDAVGTTDTYIYFDPNDADPTTLKTTSTLEDLRGYERFILCINTNGVAYPKAGVRIGSDGKTIDSDDISDGGMGVKEFHEYFQDPHGTFSKRWQLVNSTDLTPSIQPGGASGDNLLRIVCNYTSNDNATLTYFRSIPFDRNYLYRVQARIRTTAGTAKWWLGIAGRNYGNTAWVNASGNDSLSDQYFAACNDYSAGAAWEVVTGYIKGQDVAGESDMHDDSEDPALTHNDVRWFRPIFIVDFQGASGTAEIDELNVDVMSPTMGSIRPTVGDYGAIGDGVTDDTVALQNAIDRAIASGRPMVLSRGVNGIYKITSKLTIGDGTSVVTGFRLVAEGGPVIRWGGSLESGGTVNMIEMLSLSECQFDGLALDGNSDAGVSGIYFSTGAGCPAQNNTFRHLYVYNCPEVGVTIEHTGGDTTDYVMFENPNIQANGINLKVMGGTRQCILRGGRLLDADTYNIFLYDAMVEGLVTFMAGAGTSDVYLGSQITACKFVGGGSESDVILTCAAGAASGSRILGGCSFINFQQSAEPAPAGNVMEYNIWQPLTLINCKFQNNINIGDDASTVKVIDVDFIAGGFTGNNLENRIVRIGGGGSNYFQTGALAVPLWGGGWPNGMSLRNIVEDRWIGIFMSEAAPDSYYHLKGDIVFNSWPGIADPAGWRCISSGDGASETTKAVFTAFGVKTVCFSVPVENLAPGSDITTRPVWVANNTLIITTLYLLTQGTPSGIDNSNTVVLTVKDDAGNTVATKTFNTATQPPTNDALDLTSLLDADYVRLEAGDHLTLTVTQGATANMPAFLLSFGGVWV